MKLWLALIVLIFPVAEAAALPVLALAYDGYKDYPSRDDYRIEMFTSQSGLISRIVTLDKAQGTRLRELTVQETPTGVTALELFQKNRKTIAISREADIIHISITSENSGTGKKDIRRIEARLRPGPGILFEDGDSAYRLGDDGVFTADPKKKEDDSLIIRRNQIFLDGWYRSDWKRDAKKAEIKEFTTMEIPGDWMDDGGGVFSVMRLASDDLRTNVMNFYLIDSYTRSWIFLPFLFGLKTGSY